MKKQAITLEDISTYVMCSLKAHFERVSPRKTTNDLFLQRIQQAVGWFYFQLMDGKLASRQELLSHWESLWSIKGKPRALLFETNYGAHQRNEPKDPATKFISRGVYFLDNFWKYVEKGPGLPLVVYQPWQVDIGGGYSLKGVMPLIRQVKDGEGVIVEVVDFRTDRRKSTQWLISSDFRVSALSLAARRAFGVKETYVRGVNLNNGDQFFVHRKDKDHKRFLDVCRIVAEGLYEKKAWPQQSAYCGTCRHKNQCIEWRDGTYG